MFENDHSDLTVNSGPCVFIIPTIPSIIPHFLNVFVILLYFLPSVSLRAGFARQGAKEKQLLKDNNAFNVSSFVLRAMMSGQYWPEGDEVYHAELTVPTLLIHGIHDKFVPIEEDQRMAEVSKP